MRRSNNSMEFKWFLVIALVLLLLFTFISCADDIVGPRIQDDKEPDEPNDEEESPNDGSIVLPLNRPLHVKTIYSDNRRISGCRYP